MFLRDDARALSIGRRPGIVTTPPRSEPDMPIDLEKFQRALARRPASDGAHVRLAIDAGTTALLAELDVSDDLRRFLATQSFDDVLVFGRVVLNPANGLGEVNLEEPFHFCLENRLLVVGEGQGGDPVVVDLSNGDRVGFVPADPLFDHLEDEDLPDVRAWLVDTGLDLGTFLWVCATDPKSAPADARSAKKLGKAGWARLSAGS